MGNPVKMDDKNGGTPMTQETPKSWEVVFGMVKVWMVSIGGFQLVMGDPPARWMVFVNGKIPSFEMDDEQGYPYFGKPPRCLVSFSEPIPA